MATHTIWIYAKKDLPYPLSISDDEGHLSTTESASKELTTELVNGDLVKWVIHPLSDITAIVNIEESKTKIYDMKVVLPIFKTLPAPTNDGDGSWSAEMQMPDNYIKATSEYTITYTVNGQNYTQDPKLQIRKKN